MSKGVDVLVTLDVLYFNAEGGYENKAMNDRLFYRSHSFSGLERYW